MDVGYVGTKSSGLLAADDVAQKNQLDAKHLKFGADLVSILRTDADAQRFGFSGLPYPAFTGQLWQALVPYPHLASNGIGLTTFNAPLGHSTYHSLQLVVNRRSSNGLSLNWNYTFSKTIQNMESTLRGDNRRPASGLLQPKTGKVPCRQRSHPYLQDGSQLRSTVRGRQPFDELNRALEFVLGGWTLSFVGDYYSGTPLRFTAAGSQAGTAGPIARHREPDWSLDACRLLPGRSSTPRPLRRAILQPTVTLHPGFIVDHAPFTLGNAGFTVDIREPLTLRNEDISIQKGFRIGTARMQVARRDAQRVQPKNVQRRPNERSRRALRSELRM